MKFFEIGPTHNALRRDDKTWTYDWVEPMSALLVDLLARDRALCGVWHVRQAKRPEIEPSRTYGNYCVVDLHNADFRKQMIQACTDPRSGVSMELRSNITSRAVSFGLDGQAFVALRAEDPTPVSPDESLISVVDLNSIALTTDYLDGAADDD